MESAVEQQLNEICHAWRGLTGEDLLAWTGSCPGDIPAELHIEAQQAGPSQPPIAWKGETWLFSRTWNTTRSIYLAGRAPGEATGQAEPFRRLLWCLTGLLDRWLAEMETGRQAAEELGQARDGLHFLQEAANIAARETDPKEIFARILGSLLRLIPAREACLFLHDGKQEITVTAEGDAPPSLAAFLRGTALSAPYAALTRGQDLPADLAEALPGLQNLILFGLELEQPRRGVLALCNLPGAEPQAHVLRHVEQFGGLANAILVRLAREATRCTERDLQVTSKLQLNFLPKTLPELPGLEFAASLKPAYQIGGDFYDVQPTKDGLAILVGDVAGKGIPAAILTALVHATFKSESRHHTLPDELLRSINQLTYSELDRSDAFITAFLATLHPDPLRLAYASAGHTTTLLWRAASDEVVTLNSTGLPLGLSPDNQITRQQVPLSPGDVIVIYSDGITEAENRQGRVFGAQALIDLLLAAHTAPAEQQLRLILSAVDLHRDGLPLRDDLALFIIRIQPPAGEAHRAIPFVYPAVKTSVRKLAIFTRQLASELTHIFPALRATYLDELELAVSEIAANVVIHAYRHHPHQGRIQGCVTLLPDRVRVDVIDNGACFNPDAPGPPFSLADPPAGGYGLVLARRLLDCCEYTSLPNGRNHWHLEKRIPGSRVLNQ